MGKIHGKKSVIISRLFVFVGTLIFCGAVHAVEVGTLVKGAVNYYRGERIIFGRQYDHTPSRLGTYPHYQGMDRGAEGQSLYHYRAPQRPMVTEP